MQGIIYIIAGVRKCKEWKMQGTENARNGKCREWEMPGNMTAADDQ